MNKMEKLDLQHSFKKKHNKPGSPPTPGNEAALLKRAKQLVKTTD